MMNSQWGRLSRNQFTGARTRNKVVSMLMQASGDSKPGSKRQSAIFECSREEQEFSENSAMSQVSLAVSSPAPPPVNLNSKRVSAVSMKTRSQRKHEKEEAK